MLHLLVADSDTFVLDRCFRHFTDRGFHVETASDGLQCLGRLRELPPDILVLQSDLLWGGGDGVLAWLRDDSPRWPKTVVLTSDRSATDEMLLSPVKAVLPRPFSMQTLSECIWGSLAPARNVAALFLRQAERMRPQDRRAAQSRNCFFDPGRPQV
jgi:DNA-binding response OmpR family regulator